MANKRASGSNAAMLIQFEKNAGEQQTDTSTVYKLRGLTAGESLTKTITLNKSNEIIGFKGTKTGTNAEITTGGSVPLEFSATDFSQEMLVFAGTGELTQEKITWNGKSKFKKTYRRKSGFKPLTIEKQFNDIKEYIRFTGLMVNSFQIQVQATGLATISFDMMGVDANESKVSYAPNPVNQKHTTIAGKDGLRIDINGNSDRCISAIDLTINNDLTAQRCIGPATATGYGEDLGSVTGSYTGYFENLDEWLVIQEATIFEIKYRFYNTNDNYVEIFLPSVQYDGSFNPNIDSSTTLEPQVAYSGNFDEVELTDIVITYVNDNDMQTLYNNSIQKVDITSLTFDPTTADVDVGAELALNLVVVPSSVGDNDDDIKVVSLNEDIATVYFKNGQWTVRGEAEGVVKIKASSTKFPLITAEIEITVTI